MKKVTLMAGVVTLLALTACNNKTETTNETPATTQSAGPALVDLSGKGVDGMDVTIIVPDSINKNIQFAKSDYTGSLDISAGNNYKMRLTSNWASEEDPIDATLKERMSTVMHNIDSLTCKYLVKEPNLILWEYKTDAGANGYHFFAVSPDGKSAFFSMEDHEDVAHSEAAVRSMIDIFKSLKRKPATVEAQ